jgi:type VI secretion system secreted protein Hcp
LKLEGYPGDVTEKNHKDWSEANGYKHRVVLSGAPTGGGGGASAGRAVHDALSVLKWADKSSALLFADAQKGKVIPKVELDVCRPGEPPVCFLLVKLTNATIESFTQDGTAEWLGFAYGKIEWTYRASDEKGATVAQTIAGDLRANGFTGTPAFPAKAAIGYGGGDDTSFLDLAGVPGEVLLKGFERQIGLEGFQRALGADLRLSKGTDVATPTLLRLLHTGSGLEGTVAYGCAAVGGGPLVCPGAIDLPAQTHVTSLAYGASQKEQVTLALP